jgi:peptide/nickel transport system substrate-binding protein
VRRGRQGEAAIRKEEHVKRWASVLAVMALLAVACDGTSATVASPKNGGTLTVALDGDMHYADPSLVNDASSLYIARQVVEGLVGIRPGTMSDIVPVLASALPTVSSDGLAYTFKLRSGIKFHDGTEFNAAAVKFNYDRWRDFPGGDLQVNATYYALVFGAFGGSSKLAQVDAPDASTVVFHLHHPQTNFLISQTVAAFGIQSPTAIKANDGNNPTLAMNPYAMGRNGQRKTMVGTGPFMFKEWKPGDHVTLAKNPEYWNPASGPYLDRIVFKPFQDVALKVKALQSGAVDLVESLDPAGIAIAKKDSNLMVLDRGLGCNLTQLAMNSYDTVNGLPNLLSSKGVRFAIAAAVDKQAYVGAYYGDHASVADSWLPAGAQYYKREYLPTYSLGASRAYLAGAGVPTSGLNVELWYPVGAPTSLLPDPKGLAEAVSVDLQAAGFVVTLKSEAYAPNYLADEAAGKLPMWLRSQGCRWAGPEDFLYAPFAYVASLPLPMYGYANDELNALLTTAVAEPSVASARDAWYKVQDLIAADMPTVPLLDLKSPAGARKYVLGFVGSGNHTEVLASVWLQK